MSENKNIDLSEFGLTEDDLVSTLEIRKASNVRNKIVLKNKIKMLNMIMEDVELSMSEFAWGLDDILDDINDPSKGSFREDSDESVEVLISFIEKTEELKNIINNLKAIEKDL